MILVLYALILGLLQGVTEFLPISSSAHLVIVPYALGWPYFGKGFDVMLHLGSLLALLVYFKGDLLNMVRGENRSLGLYMLVSMVPGVAVALAFRHYIDDYSILAGRPWNLFLMATVVAVFAVFLWLADEKGSQQRDAVTLKDALIMGCAQALAPFPGVSRSGVTMTAGLARGLTRAAAARFSFLMSLPLVAGACLYEGLKLVKRGAVGSLFEDPATVHSISLINNDPLVTAWSVYMIGVASSFVFSYLAMRFLMSYIQRTNFMLFVNYRFVLAILLYYGAYRMVRGS